MYISYSFIKDYRSCPRKAFLHYVKRVDKDDKIDKRNFAVGACADILFSKWAREQQFKEGWMLGQAEGMFGWYIRKNTVQFRNEGDMDGMIKKLKSAVQRTEDIVLNSDLHKYEMDLQRVVKFVEPSCPTGVQHEFFCKLDIWIPEIKHIIDLKVTVSKKYHDPEQLKFYTWGLRHEGEEVDLASFLSPLMSVDLIEADISNDAIIDFQDRMFLDLQKVADGVWDEDASNCWGCPVYRHCGGIDVEGMIKSCEKVDGTSNDFTLIF